MNGRETEVKFLVRDLGRIETRLQNWGARLIQARVRESNLRFDNEQGELRKESRVLRLRKDSESKLTFKGASERLESGIITRQEIEFVVGDFDAAKNFLQALGFKPILFYEKFRATYQLREAQIMLDELPYGAFVEIESKSVAAIQETANLLRLNLDAAVKAGYSALFKRVAAKHNLDENLLSFQALAQITLSPEDLQIAYAD
ncbi:MAG: class IV adenylate cyclase [Anaerolineales bacterium]|nr:class IV adenylate cyclase [Anaerolineales bacterium]